MHRPVTPMILLILALTCQTRSWAAKPNVILVMTDDQGYGDMSVHGNPLLKTPSLDALHAQSVRLTNYHVDPTCAPTRSALLTGRYSTKTGVWHTICGRSLLDPAEMTLAEVFAANGYRTGMFGKWHLGDAYPLRPQDQGFQTAIYHGGGGVGQTPDYWDNDYFGDTYWRNGKTEPMAGYCTDVWFREAKQFVAQGDDRPFFAYVVPNAPHGPYLVDPKYSKPFESKTDKDTAAFLGMITNIDENMGSLMKFLDERGLADNTILIFTTDNGTARGHQVFNSEMRGNKGSQYDGGHRVPFLLRWPGGGLNTGQDVDQLAAHIDILPTLADLCGVDIPQGGGEIDGASLKPVLLGDKTKLRDRTLVVHSQRILHPQKYFRFSVMTDTWRLVDGKELFDIRKDPSQKTNLATANPDVVAELKSAYEGWWSELIPSINRTVHMTVGSDAEPRTRLTAHDWLSDTITPWNHGHIRSGMISNGAWAINVEREGLYEIKLCRWPEHVGKSLEAKSARLTIQDIDQRIDTDLEQTSVTFRVPLKQGESRLQTTLEMPNGQTRGAYYAYVQRVE